ncbi:MAG: replication-relaxation family protein [Solirubrobacteraceae bacterium]
MSDLPISYAEVHRYDGAAIERSDRGSIVSCAVQPRDVAIVHDVSRYKFISAPQLRELWWPTASIQAADRRLLKLFRAGYIDRFRPVSRPGTGSYPWTYCLGAAGHQLLQHADLIPLNRRHRQRLIFDFGHVLHELQLNAWVLAYRRAVGDGLLEWEGETTIEPPPGLRRGERFDDDWSAEGLSDPRARPVCPDAVLEVAGDDSASPARLLLVEYDRTRRLDRNYEKFRRYDAFLNWWWQRTHLADRGAPPFVLFVCQDDDHRDQFIAAADRELTGHRWHPDVGPERYEHIGRQRMLFASEVDAHSGRLEARRLSTFPKGHRSRSEQTRRVRIAPARAPDVPIKAENERRAA